MPLNAYSTREYVNMTPLCTPLLYADEMLFNTIVTLTKSQYRGMQRESQVIQQPNSSGSASPQIEEALPRAADEESFYTASLQFLRQRLYDKTHNAVCVSPDTSQSCCNLIKAIDNPPLDKDTKDKGDAGLDIELPVKSSLSIHQVLPFPKSSKDGFLNRLKNTFRKYCRSLSMTEPNGAEDLEVTKSISNFKFPRCQRPRSVQSTCLLQIKEESSKEYLHASRAKDITVFNDTDDVFENGLLAPIS